MSDCRLLIDCRMDDGGLTMKMRKAFLIGSVATMLAGCATGESGSDTVTIGFTGPLSGGAALYGRNVLDGLEMAIADINDAGGITVAGKQVKIAVAPLDDRYFPNESATN